MFNITPEDVQTVWLMLERHGSLYDSVLGKLRSVNKSSLALQKYGTDENRCEHQIRLVSTYFPVHRQDANIHARYIHGASWGVGFLYVGSSNIVPQWFSKRSSLANGISAAGAPLGGFAYSLAINSMLEGPGPALTFRILAICAFIPNLIAIILLHDRNNVQQPNQSAFDHGLLKRLEIWLMVGWGCLSELGHTVLLYSLPNYARRIGLNAHQGSIVGALINLGLLIGRPFTGYLSDTWGRINLATLTTGLCGVACLCGLDLFEELRVIVFLRHCGRHALWYILGISCSGWSRRRRTFRSPEYPQCDAVLYDCTYYL